MNALAGRYRIERELGRGGMGVVHLAWDLRNRRNVALKVLRPEIANVIGRDRFLREIDISASLSHPHILPLYDSGEEDGELYYVMPHVQGESLADRIRSEGMLEISESLRIAREVADALAYAHSKGIVHRDIKPGNVLLESGHAVVSDFGMAVLVATVPEARLTSTGITVGTPIYMSPEQSLGRREIDGRADIYSLGCVLYEMLCGEPPFGTREPQAILARKMAPPPRMREARDTISDSVERVTRKALCKNAADRFRSAHEFMHALDGATADQTREAAQDETDPEYDYDDVEEASPRVERSVRTRSYADIGLKRVFAGAASAFVLFTMTGFVVNSVYNVRMQIPPEYTSWGLNLIVLGARALAPDIILGAMWVAGYFILKLLARLFIASFGRVPTVEQSVQSWRLSSSGMRRRLVDVRPKTVAEVFFAVSIVLSLAVVFTFGSFLSVVLDDSNAKFAPACKDHYFDYTTAMSGAFVALTAAWLRLLRYLRSRRAGASTMSFARTSGLAVILAMILLKAAPWRLYFDNEKPLATLDDQTVYVLVKNADGGIYYNPHTHTTGEYATGSGLALRELGTRGYVFEDETGCAAPTR